MGHTSTQKNNLLITRDPLESLFPLETNRLVLRKVRVSDAEKLYNEYTSDIEVVQNASWKAHADISETINFIEHCLKEWTASSEFNLCICLKEYPDSPIGMFKLKNNGSQINIGYVLSKNYWRKGLTSEAIVAVCQKLFTIPNINIIHAYTDPENAASIAVLKKTGFVYSHRIKNHLVRPQLSSKPRDSVIYTLSKTQ